MAKGGFHDAEMLMVVADGTPQIIASALRCTAGNRANGSRMVADHRTLRLFRLPATLRDMTAPGTL